MEQQRTQDNLIRREARSKKMISMISASTATPQNRISTTELVASMMHNLSPELINTICSLGVENRYSAMDNYADFLTGASMHPTSSTTELGVNATRKCIEEWGGDPSQIGLLIAATKDRKSTRLNSSHQIISYACFCLKKKGEHTLHFANGPVADVRLQSDY